MQVGYNFLEALCNVYEVWYIYIYIIIFCYLWIIKLCLSSMFLYFFCILWILNIKHLWLLGSDKVSNAKMLWKVNEMLGQKTSVEGNLLSPLPPPKPIHLASPREDGASTLRQMSIHLFLKLPEKSASKFPLTIHPRVYRIHPKRNFPLDPIWNTCSVI